MVDYTYLEEDLEGVREGQRLKTQVINSYLDLK